MGEISLRGPKFQIECVQGGDTEVRLRTLLSRFHPGDREWSIIFITSDTGSAAEPGSLQYAQEAAQHESDERRKQKLMEHPVVTSLRTVFPGSSVESIRVKH